MKAAVLALCLLGAACVPADDAIRLGATGFAIGATSFTRNGVPASATEDGFAIRFDRIALGFKTMTVGKVGSVDTCSYRGSAQRADVVFDPRRGLGQVFNGIQPVLCPDVGIIFGPPDGATTSPGGTEWAIRLRFDTATTASRFGGCHLGPNRGVTVLAGQRDDAAVLFGAENLFREYLADNTSALRGQPFAIADTNGDHVTTMPEIDALPLSALGAVAYQLVDGTQQGTFGDFLRQLFRFTVSFRDETGECIGNDPAVPE